MKINHALSQMPKSYLFSEIASRVAAYEKTGPARPLIRLGIGDVTRPLAPSVAEAFSQAARNMATPEGFFGYGPDGGYPFLKEAILKNDYLARGVRLETSELFISDGAKSDTAGIQELFSPDAVIAVTDPVYPVYVDANAMAGRLGSHDGTRWEKLVTLPTTADNGFVPPLPTEKVDVIYLCYPNNPTGTVLKRQDLARFVDYARRNGVVIVYDAAYKAFITEDDVPHSIYEIEGAQEVAIECCSFSKTAGFTGVRCAYTVVPKALKGKNALSEDVSLNALWARRQGSKYNGVSYPVQKAAEAVYAPEGQREIAESIAYYQRNAALILEKLGAMGYTVFGGVNAPYVWMQTPKGLSGWDFFDLLLKNAQVVGTPGEGFGACGNGFFRLTAFNTYDNTLEALRRIEALKI